MNRSDPITITFDALFRPTQLMAYIESGWRQKVLAVVAVLEVLGATFAGIAFGLGQLFPIGTRALLIGGMVGPLLAYLVMVFLGMAAGSDFSTRDSFIFAFVRCQIAIAPPAMLFLTLIYSTTFGWLEHDARAALVLLLLLGAWSAGSVSVALNFPSRRTQAAAVRWVITVGALLAGCALGFSPAFRGNDSVLLAPWAIGFGVALLRPLSYSGEVLLSLGLTLGVLRGVAPQRVLPFHPMFYDELLLLPLPGLRFLLVRACRADMAVGGAWLLRVAEHPSQGGAALRAIAQILRANDHTHPLLFWLSTSAAGIALLERFVNTHSRPQPLITAYIAFAHVTDLAAWPSVIAQHRQALTKSVDLPGGRAIEALLATAAGIMRAERWEAARTTLQNLPVATGVESDPLWEALATIRSWADQQQLALMPERTTALRMLRETLESLDGWPAALLAALSDHLAFLLTVEQRRGAWLV